MHFSGLTSEMLIDPSLSLSMLTVSRLLCRCSNRTPTLNDVQMTDESSHNERALLWSRGQVLTLAHACCVLHVLLQLAFTKAWLTQLAMHKGSQCRSGSCGLHQQL